MQHHWLRNLSVIVLAGLVLVGCSSSGKEGPASGTAAWQRTAGVTAPAQSDSEISRSVDASGNPINPQTGVALTRVFYFDYDKATSAAGIAGDSRAARGVSEGESRSSRDDRRLHRRARHA